MPEPFPGGQNATNIHKGSGGAVGDPRQSTSAARCAGY